MTDVRAIVYVYAMKNTAAAPKPDYTKVCVVCRRDIETCKVPGLHGMTRDRTAKAMRELAK